MSIVEAVKELWYVVLGAGTAVAGVVKWRIDRKVKDAAEAIAASTADADSTEMLYAQLELMKKKLITSVQQDMARATDAAEQRHIIATFKIHCPDCYITVMSKIYPDGHAKDL
jgi:hypothetical protein